MDLLNSALADRYRIERQIGQGGMATVYLARDIRHERRVALKVLNPELGAVVGVERFLTEIRVTANLQHPHLLPLFDSGQAEGQLYYVMPYVEGESLRARIHREKQLPIDEALRIAMAVGSALDYAHRHGVIHRDLKPENILLQEGQPLVADFGIALAVSLAGGARVTQTGISLGTPHYMSPEQATGDRQIDGRTDIYSLGAVLYEMLTGDPPHTGSTAHAIIAKVLTDKPRAVRLSRETVPPHVETAIDCALSKLPADRFATAQEFADALRGARPVTIPTGFRTPASPTTDPALRRARRRAQLRAEAPWGVAFLALVAAGLLWLKPEPPRQVARLYFTVSDSARLRTPPGVTIALSPDGSRLAYTGGPDNDGQLFLRDLSDLDAKPIRGTERALNPIFSPDGRNIAFVVDGKLRRIGVEGGTSILIADSAGAASWGDGDVIVFGRANGVFRTTSNGEPPTLIHGADTARRIVRVGWPHLLPGSAAALVTVWKGGSLADASIAALRLADGALVEFGVPGVNPRYLPTGHVLFGRADGSSYVMPFDARKLRVSGSPVPMIEGVMVKPGGAMEVAVASNGTMMYRSGAATRRLVVVDRRGVESAAVPEIREFIFPRISPDGKRIAVAIGTSMRAGTGADTWVFDTQSGTLTRLTQTGGERPEWSSDGKNVLSIRTDSGIALSQPWDASGTPSVYTSVPNGLIFELSLPRHGRGYLAARVQRRGISNDIWIAPVDTPRALRPFLATPALELMPSVSPDGRLLAYLSNESGKMEVYVRPMPGPGARVQVSTDGGSEPMWSPNGKEVFYRAGGKFMSARLTWHGENATVSRTPLFEDTFASGAPAHQGYSVAPDGDHFLFTKSTAGDSKASSS